MESEVSEHSNNCLSRSNERARIDHSSICNNYALKLDGKMSVYIFRKTNVRLHFAGECKVEREGQASGG
jgi:hypothetical protein